MLSLYPELVEEGAVEVVLMGGCMGVGNTGGRAWVGER